MMMSIFFYNIYFKFIILCILGLISGSLINVIICRLPIMLIRDNQFISNELTNNFIDSLPTKFNLFVPRSMCYKCLQPIAWYHNIPILSFVLLRGKCYFCHSVIAIRYVLIELLTALLFILLGYTLDNYFLILSSMLLITIIIPIIVIDYKYLLLPDELTLLLLWCGILININGNFGVSLKMAILGAVVAYLFLRIIYHIFKIMTNKDAMGFGDFKLFAALCAWFGLQAFIPILFLSSFLGICYYLFIYLFYSANKNTQIPFGSCLGVSGILITFYPNIFTIF